MPAGVLRVVDSETVLRSGSARIPAVLKMGEHQLMLLARSYMPR